MNNPTEAMQKKIMVVDDDQDFRWAISNVLSLARYDVRQAPNGDDALKLLNDDMADLVLLDQRMPGQDGIAVAECLYRQYPSLPIIMVTAYSEVKTAVKAMKIGVRDYVTKPVNNNDLLYLIEEALQHADILNRNLPGAGRCVGENPLFETMGRSHAVQTLAWKVEKVAASDLTVLIEGESGVGKELVAQTIHALSPMKEGPFVAVNCGAIPETLIESELFGYMKGAFTGAQENKPGFFELAQDGTLFLDEVGCLPYGAQQKLLRTVQERCVQRLGAKRAQPVQIRIVAATNQALDQDRHSERFRSDLYYRLKEFYIRVPALRERKEDIPYLAKRFFNRNRKRSYGRQVMGFSDEAMEALLAHDWPGNVRELKNIVRQASLICEGQLIEPGCLALHAEDEVMAPAAFPVPATGLGGRSLTDAIKHVSGLWEKEIIRETLKQSRGNKREAARRLKIDYKTLYRKLKSHGLGGTGH